jgi:hypothetical protein
MAAHKSEAPLAGGAIATNQNEYERTIVADRMATDKGFARIAAHLALAGFALRPLACGGFLIAKFDHTSYAPDLHAAAAFLNRLRER